MITVSIKVKGSIEQIWDYFTNPKHIIHWNFASEDWQSPWAKNDLRVGGKFDSRMEAKDGSSGFNFEGVYTEMTLYKGYTYELEDGRKIIVTFGEEDGKVIVREDFDPETENTIERQQYGWQSILDNFKKYSESVGKETMENEAGEIRKIVPHLWFDAQALEAAELYVSLFEDSAITNTGMIFDTPSGDAQTVEFQLAGLEFSAISAGPYFAFNPSISLMIACETKEEVDRLYNKLIDGGGELMPLGSYSFSKWYAWIRDRFGLNWQIMLVEDIKEHKKIRPSLLFGLAVCGKAQEAMDYYASIFPASKIGYVDHYLEGEANDIRAKIKYAELNIFDLEMVMMDHGYGGEEKFNEAISFMIQCEDQKEIDYFWEKLSFVPEAEQCGWVKDQFGISWQIVPKMMGDLLSNGTKEELERVTKAFLKMKKFDIIALENAKIG